MLKSEILEARKRIGKRFRENREAYGITQASLSVHSGMSSRTISMMECGKFNWRFDSELRYLTSLKALIEANEKRRATSRRYIPPVILSPEIAIFQKYTIL